MVAMTCRMPMAGPPLATGGPGDGGGGSDRVPHFPWWAAVVLAIGGCALGASLLVVARRLAPSVERYRAIMGKRLPPGGTGRKIRTHQKKLQSM